MENQEYPNNQQGFFDRVGYFKTSQKVADLLAGFFATSFIYGLVAQIWLMISFTGILPKYMTDLGFLFYNLIIYITLTLILSSYLGILIFRKKDRKFIFVGIILSILMTILPFTFLFIR